MLKLNQFKVHVYIYNLLKIQITIDSLRASLLLKYIKRLFKIELGFNQAKYLFETKY